MNSAALHVWLVDDDASIRWCWSARCATAAWHRAPLSGRAGARCAKTRVARRVVTTPHDGPVRLDLLKRIHETRPALPVIVMTAHSDLGSAYPPMAGAFEYLPKPFDIDHAVDLVRRAARARPQGNIEAVPVPRIPQLRARRRRCSRCSAPSAVSPAERHGAHHRRIGHRQRDCCASTA